MKGYEQLAQWVSISDSLADRENHSSDISGHSPHKPDVIAYPESTAQIARLLSWANVEKIPVTPWGAGTSAEGNPISVRGGICLSLERMQRVLELSIEDRLAVVQPNVKYRELNRQLSGTGWHFAVAVGGDATIGGMIANNAAGPKAVKYGATKVHVLGLEVVLADGRVIRTGGRSAKQSCGYNLTQLFVGSEGTLGVITEAIVKLTPEPSFEEALVAQFPTVAHALHCASTLSGLDAGAIEFLDRAYMGFLSEAPADTLFCEFHSPGHAAEAERRCWAAGATAVRRATEAAERTRLWAARLRAYTASAEANPGARLLTTDTAVPVGRLQEMVSFLQQELSRRNLTGYLLGHAGDGNVHVILPWLSEAQRQAVNEFSLAAVEKSLSLGGTASGEHGVGIGKRDYLQREHGPVALGLMREIKSLLDPAGILNPGKLLPD